MRATVVTGGDASPVFEAGEQVLDFVTLTIEMFVVGVPDLAIGLGRDAWGDAASGRGVAEPIAVVAFVSQQFLGLGWLGRQQSCAFMIAHLPFGEQPDDRPTLAIADCVQLRVKPTPGAPDTSGKSPLLEDRIPCVGL